jgi:hypothetical protein
MQHLQHEEMAVVFTLGSSLKVPKCENIDLLFFTLINHIWEAD